MLDSSISPAADRVLIVTNPTAGGAGRSAQAIQELITCLRRQQLGVELVGDLATLADCVAEHRAGGRLRALVAAGGDGTVAEIVNRAPAGVPVTVYPLGTANLLAGYLGIRRDPQEMARLLAHGTTIRLDAAAANGRIFLLMAGCGFDADVVHRLHRKRRGRRISYWTYAGPMLESIRRYRFPKLRVYCEAPAGETAAPVQSARWAFVANLPVYASGLIVAPDAVGNDGQLDVCTFSQGTLWHGVRYIGHTLLGRHHRLPDYQRALAKRVRIEADRPVPYQLDGDPGGMLPLEIEVLSERLTLWVSGERAAALAGGRNNKTDSGAQ